MIGIKKSIIQKRKEQLIKALEHDFPEDNFSGVEKMIKEAVLEAFRNFVLYGKTTKDVTVKVSLNGSMFVVDKSGTSEMYLEINEMGERTRGARP